MKKMEGTARTRNSPQQREIEVHLNRPFDKQQAVIDSKAKRKIIRAGRRGGKTIGASIIASIAFAKAIKAFLAKVEMNLIKSHITYAAPTTEQTERFWFTVTNSFLEAVDRGALYKNESERILKFPNTDIRIKAKTAWNADTLRGDFADLLILDEWQLMDEDAWELVGAPMLLDNDGDAIFIYTPPSLHSRSVSKAKDPQHAAKMFLKAKLEAEAALKEGRQPRWEAFHWRSQDNPTISADGLSDIVHDMTSLAYRMEILAEDIDEAPGALWKRADIEKNRVSIFPDLARVVVGVDPSATSTGDEAGIIVAGTAGKEGYVLGDLSIQGSPMAWAKEAVSAYHKFKADRIVAEANNGGEMVELTIRQVDSGVPIKLVHASRGKQTRAEPISAIYEQGRVHHVGAFNALEDEMCLWIPGDPSPNRMDALVWAMTELKISSGLGMLDFMAAQHKAAEEKRKEEEKKPIWKQIVEGQPQGYRERG
jgi:hypothetical protein